MTNLSFLLEVKRIDLIELSFLGPCQLPSVGKMLLPLTSWKKKVALLACRAAWESAGAAAWLAPFWAASVGVAESFLMSYTKSVSGTRTNHMNACV